MAYERYIENIPNVGPQFNVGNIVGDVHKRFLAPPAPNRATPENMAGLLEGLEELTARIRKESFVVPGIYTGGQPMPQPWYDELDAWEKRLKAYRNVVDAAPRGDRAFIQDQVTVPLLIGRRQVGGSFVNADLATPFMLANQLQLTREFMGVSLEKFLRWIGESLPTIPSLPDIKIPGVSGKVPTWLVALGLAGTFALVAYGVGRLR